MTPTHWRCLPAWTLALFSALPAHGVTPDEAQAELLRTLDAPLRQPSQPAPPGLAARMQQLPVRGISIAVIHQGRLHWAQAWGEAKEGVPATPETRFQAASISKAVSALGVLALAESRGVGLDDDLRPLLKRWQPAAESPEPPQPRYTLRQLLSHRAGLGQHGFPGYALGAPLPSLPQILDGLPPANTGPVRPVQAPAQGFRYSGGGSTVVQLWVEDVTGQPFAAQMQQWALGPLGMTNSQYGPPARTDDPRFAASHQGRVPEPGGFRVYPELQAAGLWTTPSDIAKAWMGVQAALAQQPSPVSASVAKAATSAIDGPTALGFFVDGGAGPAQRFEHNGSNQGFESYSTAYVHRGEGVVIMANGQNTWPLVDAVVRTLGRVYGWPGLASATAAADQALSREAARWVGRYRFPQGPELRIERRNAALWWARGPGDWQRLWRLQDGTYATDDGQARAQFTAQGLVAHDQLVPRQPARAWTWPAMHLRGSFNGWAATQPFRAAGAGRWVTELTLPEGAHEFKVGDASWNLVNLGSDSPTPVGTGEWVTLRGQGGNLPWAPAPAGRYRVELRLADGPQAAQLRWTRLH